MLVLADLEFEKDLGLDIYQFRDYRAVLSAYFEACREQSKRYSFRHFMKRLGLNSPGYLQLIIQGKKSVSERLLGELIQLMGLKQRAREYFELLVKIERIDFSSPLYQEYFDALQTMRSKRMNVKTIDEAQCRCVASWFHWVVREMTLLKGAHLKVQWFKRALNRFVPLSGKQIISIVKDLKEAELLEEKNGEIVHKDPILNLKDDTISTSLKMYHKGSMEQGILGLSNKGKEREYGAILVATTPDKVEIMKKKLRQFRHDMLQLLDTPSGEASELISFAYQLFPVAQVDDSEHS